MPATDRRWRLFLGLAVFMALVCLALAGYDVLLVAPANLEHGRSPFAGLSWSDAWLPVYLLVFVPSIFSWALAGHKRERLRKRAISGQPDAVPPSIVVPNPADAPDVSMAPLLLAWRKTHTPHAVLFSLALLVTLPATTLGSLFLLIWVGIRNAVLVLGVPTALLVANIFVYAILMRRRAPDKRLEWLVATHSGLVWQRTGRADVEIPWYDARLLEIWQERHGRGAEPLQGYTLYGRIAHIEWRNLPAAWIAPEGMTYSELAHRQRQLLDLIAARTRLAPRTFAADLQQPETLHPQVRISQILTYMMSGALCLLIFGGLLGLTAAALILPITDFALLNALTAGALAVVSAYFVVFLVVVVAKARQQRTFDVNYPLPSLSEEARAVDRQAGLRYQNAPRVRAQFIICGLLLTWQIVPACIAIFGSSTAPTPSQHHNLQSWVLGGLLFCAFCGLACIWPALRDRWTDVWANAEGLHERGGRRARFLPWETVQMVQVETIAGKVDAFRVTGAASLIWWPAGDARILPPPDADTLALTPDELAALVVARAGRSLTVA